MRPRTFGGGGLGRIITKETGSHALTVEVKQGDSAVAVNLFNTADTLFATFGVGVVLDERASWVITYDDGGDRLVHVFKDGAEAGYSRRDVVVGTPRATTNPWLIGNEGQGVRGLDGAIDDVRIYDRVLSDAEIAAPSAACPP